MDTSISSIFLLHFLHVAEKLHTPQVFMTNGPQASRDRTNCSDFPIVEQVNLVGAES